MDSITGTYYGVLPSDVETTLTLNARLRGTFQVLDYNILMLVHPSSGEHTFYKVKDANHIVLIDSFGNESQKEDKKNYILKGKYRKKYK